MRVEWTKDLETGIKSIDEEHKNLIEILNDLNDVLSHDVDKMNEVFDRLIAYTEYHFGNEEGLMMASSYDCGDHCNFHELFKDRILEFKEISDRKGLSFSKSMQKFLIEWFVNHIKKTDKEMAKSLEK